jgi:hypothetical protein
VKRDIAYLTQDTTQLRSTRDGRIFPKCRFWWRELQAADGSEPGAKALTAWSTFPHTTKYFGSSKADFMLNDRVDDLDAVSKK